MRTRSHKSLSGAELRELRRAAGLTQAEFARLAKIGRHAVSYWECKSRVPRHQWAPSRMLKALGVEPMPYFETGSRARGDGVLLPDWVERKIEAELERVRKRKHQTAARSRCVCGAKTRKGTTCRNLSEPGKRRCKFHGGMSTGPRTADGRARIAEAQRDRWSALRRERSLGSVVEAILSS